MDMNLFRKSQTQTPDKDILSGVCVWDLIPYLEPAGNYNTDMQLIGYHLLIPYLELAGNYNSINS